MIRTGALLIVAVSAGQPAAAASPQVPRWETAGAGSVRVYDRAGHDDPRADFADADSLIDRAPVTGAFTAAPAPPVVPQRRGGASSVSRGREGIFQKLDVLGTWLPALDNDEGLGVSDLLARITFGFPFPTRQSPLLLTPKFGVHYLDGPVAPDLPPRVFDAALEVRWMRRFGPRLMGIVAVEPGMYSDFDVDSADAFRIPGRALAIYDWSAATQLVLGVVYLDRSDTSLLPAAGLIWKPNDWWRVELIAPQPKIAHRLDGFQLDRGAETWVYLGGELGGGAWAIRRTSGIDDMVSVWDYRVLLGWENKVSGGINTRCEVGYVFGRVLEFGGGTPDFEPNDTLMLRAGVSY